MDPSSSDITAAMTAILSGNIVELETTDHNLKCVICKNIMINPYQSLCECQFCNSCIVNYLSAGNINCPSGKASCRDEHIILDDNTVRNPVLNRKIQRSRIKCPNPSCEFIAGWLEMLEHLRVCPKTLVKCPFSDYGCDSDKMDKENMLLHLHNDALSHTQFLIDDINLVKNEMKEDFVKKTDNMVYMEQLSWNTEEKLRNLEEKLIQSKREIDGLKDQVKRLMMKIDPTTTESLHEFVENPENRSVTTPASNLQKFQRSQSVTRVKRDSDLVCDFNEMSLTISRFSDKRYERVDIYSDYFYSHKNGYKLRLHVYPGGHMTQSHMSVYIIICKGEYDDQLQWPCPLTFTISIIDQYTKQPFHSEAYNNSRAKDNSTSFDKPIDRDNFGHGSSKFVSNLDINTHIKRYDSVIIKCSISDTI